MDAPLDQLMLVGIAKCPHHVVIDRNAAGADHQAAGGILLDLLAGDGFDADAGLVPGWFHTMKLPVRLERTRQLSGQTKRRSVAHLVSSWRVESWSFRSTEETCDSTVLVEMVRSRATSL
jgi:hypothetical protein